MTTRKFCSTAVFGYFLFLAAASHASAIIFVNFGNNIVADAGWNSLTTRQAQSGWESNVGPFSLIDSTGAATDVTMEILVPFWDQNAGGYGGGAVGDFVASATATTLYHIHGNSNVISDTPTYEIAGLDPNLTYTFNVFGSRVAGGNRETVYTFTGINSGFDSLNPAGNSSDIATIAGISPTAEGIITFVTSQGPNSDSSYFYINAMSITAVPEPATYAVLCGLFSIAFLIIRRHRK